LKRKRRGKEEKEGKRRKEKEKGNKRKEEGLKSQEGKAWVADKCVLASSRQ
jgi:hypothetical protein